MKQIRRALILLLALSCVSCGFVTITDPDDAPARSVADPVPDTTTAEDPINSETIPPETDPPETDPPSQPPAEQPAPVEAPAQPEPEPEPEPVETVPYASAEPELLTLETLPPEPDQPDTAPTRSAPTETEAPPEEYVLNTNTRKIHKSSCRDVEKILPENYATTTDPAAYLADGYTNCGHCHGYVAP